MNSASRPSPRFSLHADTGSRRQVVAGFGLAVPLTVVSIVRGDRATDLVVAWLLIACGLLVGDSARSARRSGWLLLLTGWAWLAGAVLHRGPLAHLLLTWPTGRSGSRWVSVVIAVAYADAIVGSVVPSDTLTLAYATIMAATAIARLATSSGLARRGRMAGATGALAIAGLTAGSQLIVVVAGPAAASRVATAYDALVAAIAVAMVLDARFGGWTAGAVTGVVVELGGSDAQSLAGRLGRVLGDPSLTLALAREGSYVDETGRPVQVEGLPSGRAALPIAEEGTVIGYVIHDAAVLEDAALVEAVAVATRIAVGNLRLRADIDAGARAIAASRSRVMSAADDQRRRMERRVFEGPIARLERARAHVELAAREGAPGRPAGLPVDVAGQLQAATHELRVFALGLYPATLSQGGLAVAVAMLASATPLPVAVDIDPARLPEPVEAAAYFVCAEAIANTAKHAHATRVSVRGSSTPGSLRVTITDDGVGGADPEGWGLRGLRDRVGFLGGTLSVTSPDGRGTRVEAVLPVASPSSGQVRPVSLTLE